MLRNEVSRIFIEIYICQFHHQRYINPESLSHYGSKAAAPHKPWWGRLSVWNLLNVTPLCSTSHNAWGTGLKNDFTLNITLESLLKSLSSKTLMNMYKVYVIKVTESTRGHWHTYVHGSFNFIFRTCNCNIDSICHISPRHFILFWGQIARFW